MVAVKRSISPWSEGFVFVGYRLCERMSEALASDAGLRPPEQHGWKDRRWSVGMYVVVRPIRLFFGKGARQTARGMVPSSVDLC